MITHEWLAKRPALFKNFTGLEVSEFDSFYAKAEANYDEYEKKRLEKTQKEKKTRKRKVGAGHPFKLLLKDRLLLLLVYYRLYISTTLAGVLFDIDQSNADKDIHKLEPLVESILPLPKKVHDKVRRLQTLEEIKEMFPEFKAFTDGTEQEIPRPKEKEKRRTHYSGKRKRHTVKTQLTVNSRGLIIHKTRHVKGSTHDYALFKLSRPHLPESVKEGFDLGYVGVKDDFPGLNCVVPFKRKNPGWGKVGVKAQELSPEQRAFNKELASERVVVEHTNSRVKKFQIWGGEFRNRPRFYDLMTDIVSGLVNFRILGSLVV